MAVTDLPDLSFSTFADPSLDLEPREVYRRIRAGEMILVDVREQYEWDAGHIPGSVHHEVERVGWRAPTLPRDTQIAFMCRLGVRGGMVATAFRAVGYDAWNVLGGFDRWYAAGLPTEPDGAVVAEH
jgi:rhodanese-related sulfurtransferase